MRRPLRLAMIWVRIESAIIEMDALTVRVRTFKWKNGRWAANEPRNIVVHLFKRRVLDSPRSRCYLDETIGFQGFEGAEFLHFSVMKELNIGLMLRKNVRHLLFRSNMAIRLVPIALL